MERDRIPKDCVGKLKFIGYEYNYPDILKSLMLVKEKLIAFNITYSFITKFDTKRDKTVSGYRKYIKDYIIVFPNNIQILKNTILLYLFLSVIENIYIIWISRKKPIPENINKLFNIQKSVIVETL